MKIIEENKAEKFQKEKNPLKVWPLQRGWEGKYLMSALILVLWCEII